MVISPSWCVPLTRTKKKLLCYIEMIHQAPSSSSSQPEEYCPVKLVTILTIVFPHRLISWKLTEAEVYGGSRGLTVIFSNRRNALTPGQPSFPGYGFPFRLGHGGVSLFGGPILKSVKCSTFRPHNELCAHRTLRNFRSGFQFWGVLVSVRRTLSSLWNGQIWTEDGTWWEILKNKINFTDSHN